MLKTKFLWEQSKLILDDYLNVGDLVDEEIVDYFISVLPPVTLQANIIQLGEAYTHDISGNPIYLTICREPGTVAWTCAGHLPTPDKIDLEYLHKVTNLEG